MRAITLLFILFACKSFAQRQLYTLNDGVYLNEGEFKRQVDSIKKDPYSSNLRFVIYHKAHKKDTVINYYSPAVLKGHTPVRTAKSSFKVVFSQNPAFLLLDKKLPYFKLKDADGKMVTSNALLGKPTLLSFWANNCQWCEAELPELINLQHQYKNRVNFVAISKGNLAGTGLSQLIKGAKIDFRVLINGDAYQKAIKFTSPRYLLIDKNGLVKNIQFYYPVNASAQPMPANDASNYFVRLLNALVK
jgi:thiol-disulfide isomerase/thioredoxin